jgi:hypothetical protein
MSTWTARLAILGVFMLGGVCGAAAMHLYRLRLERQIMRSPAPLAQLVIVQLDRELKLSVEQEKEIGGRLLEIRRDTLASHPELASLVAETFERASAQIREVLTDSQRPRFEEMVEERRRLLEEARRSVGR